MHVSSLPVLIIGLVALPLLAYAAGPEGRTDTGSIYGQRLQQQIGPEERFRMHRELNEDSGKAYPDQEQIESRRQMMRERMRERLNRADSNGDGAISRSEADRSMPGVARHFEQIDIDGDGTITRDEMRDAREKMREIQQQKQEALNNESAPATEEHRPARKHKRRQASPPHEPPAS